MDASGRIYIDDPERIPAEDRARLDGYLRGRADAFLTMAERDRERRLVTLEAEMERRAAKGGTP